MNLIEKKLCNAFIQDAQVSYGYGFILSKLKAKNVLTVIKYLLGGLWVGGNVFLYEDAIAFRPNIANKLAHKGDVSWEYPLTEIEDVFVSFGIVTQIVNLRTKYSLIRIRCYGANKFADNISCQVNHCKE